MSWLVEKDVQEGRDHLNFSRWDQYTTEERQRALAEIATVAKNHEMPLPRYTIIHRESRLSDAEADLLYRWSRVERRRLKAELPFASVHSAPAKNAH